MTPTPYLRWDERQDYYKADGVAIGSFARVLQQFWHISESESDIALPKERGPNGELGRWRDVT